ncbi:MAG TPA: hypothetical protein VER03_02055, partial [Bryobacteraceae bacterium]|nr:hypothetical protein [Bryobacteraceae bacterium]
MDHQCNGRKAGSRFFRTIALLALGFVAIAALAVFGLFRMLTKPDPDGNYGTDARSPDRALYYTKRHIRAELRSQGATNVAFCDSGDTEVVRAAAFVYLVRSCVEFDRGGQHQKLRFFAQAERSPMDGPSYSLVQLKFEDAAEQPPEKATPAEPVVDPTPPEQVTLGRYRAVASAKSLGEGAFDLYFDNSRV